MYYSYCWIQGYSCQNIFLSLKNSIFSKNTVVDKNAWEYPCPFSKNPLMGPLSEQTILVHSNTYVLLIYFKKFTWNRDCEASALPSDRDEQVHQSEKKHMHKNIIVVHHVCCDMLQILNYFFPALASSWCHFFQFYSNSLVY